MGSIENDCERALACAEAARLYREEARWRVRKDDPARRERIKRLLEELRLAMAPIRSHIGRFAHEPFPDADVDAVFAASKALQYERRQLKKML